MRKIDRRIVIVVSVIFILGLAYGLMRFLVAQKEPPPVRRSVESRRFVKVDPVQVQQHQGPGYRAGTPGLCLRSGYCFRSIWKN